MTSGLPRRWQIPRTTGFTRPQARRIGTRDHVLTAPNVLDPSPFIVAAP